ncbi:HEAT repeat domain-containing protein [Haloarcula sp. CBA1127]|uniref:HEAT repeat domain-containing protein n=1 Tax=Haloarcula sp. CBA1127 TaxID=1765055 RepID=UPI00073F19A6|nr:HEAT repeat domain-containing protein [Haloarcula sp. CBA1127]
MTNDTPDDAARRAKELRETVDPATASDDEIEALCALLDGRHGRSDAQEALWKIGAHPNCTRRVAESLQPYVVHETRRTREEARDMLTWVAQNDLDALDTTVEWLVENLDTEDEHVRETAVTALEALVETKPVLVRSHVDEIIDCLDDESLRGCAITLLATISYAYPMAIAPARHDLLALTEDETVEESPLSAPLVQIALVCPDIVDPVVEGLRDRLTEQAGPHQIGTAVALANVAIAYPDQLSVVVEELLTRVETEMGDRFRNLARGEILGTVGRIGAAHPDAVVPELDRITPHLESDDHRLRSGAVKALGDIATVRPAAVRPTVDDLVTLVDDNDESVRNAAVTELGKIAAADPEVAPRVVTALDDRFDSTADTTDPILAAVDERYRDDEVDVSGIIDAYKRIGATHPEALDPAIEDLRTCLDDEVLSCDAAEALGEIGASRSATARPAVEDLRELLDDGSLHNRSAAAIALGKIGADDSEVAALVRDDLQTLAEDRQRYVREAAAEALGTIAAADTELPTTVSDSLRPLVDDEDRGVRVAALESLGKIGASDPNIDPHWFDELQADLGDVDAELREETAEALGRIGASHPELAAPAADVLQSRLDCDEEYIDLKASIAEAVRTIKRSHSDAVTRSETELQRYIDAVPRPHE